MIAHVAGLSAMQMSILQDVRLAFRLSDAIWPGRQSFCYRLRSPWVRPRLFLPPSKAILIDPLPYGRAEELVQLRSEFPKIDPMSALGQE
jgi:hypothetical protein